MNYERKQLMDERTYESPELVELGSVSEMTENAPTGVFDGTQ